MALVNAAGGADTATEFWTQTLIDLGAPVTQSNIEALAAWSEREGSGGAWNPLNTTRPAPGSTNLAGNSAKVQNYPSLAVGAQATADSLNNGLYPSIVAAFKSGSAFEALVSGGKGAIGAQLRKWSGGAYNNVNASSSGYVSPTLGGKSTGGSNTVNPSNSSNTGGAATGACLTLAESITNASTVASVVPGEQQIAGFFGWITQSCVRNRLLFQGVSALLILYGLKFMGHSDPIKIVSAPVRAARSVI
jgi:hypothetical protein